MTRHFPKKTGSTPRGNGGARGSSPRGRGAKRVSAGREIAQGVVPDDYNYVDGKLYIPKTEDLKKKVRDSEKSLCNKIPSTSVGELTEFMVGERAYKRIFDTPLHSVLIEHVRDFKKHFTDNIESLKSLGDTLFPSFTPDRDFREQKLLEGNLYQFLATVNKKLISLWLLPHEKSDRRQALESLAKAFVSWREDRPLVTRYAATSYSLSYLTKLKKHLTGLPPQEIQDLISGMATNLMNFTGLLYVHILGLFVKFGVNESGVLELYYRKTFSAAKQAGHTEASMSEAPSASENEAGALEGASGDEIGRSSPKKKKKTKTIEAVPEDEDNEEKTAVKKRKLAVKRERVPDSPENESDGKVQAPPKKSKKSDVITLSDDEDGPPTPPVFDIGRVKNEFDAKKIKKEKSANGGDSLPLGAEASNKLETASRTSSNPGPMPLFGSYVPMVAPVVTDANDPYLEKMLKELEEDTTLSTSYRHMFSMLVANNRDLRQNNANLTLMNRNQEQLIRQREARIQELEMYLMRFNAPFNNVHPPGFM